MMKLAGRWLFNFVAAVSMAMLLLTLILYIRSFFKIDDVTLVRGTDTATAAYEMTYVARQSRGRIWVYFRQERMPHAIAKPMPDDVFIWSYQVRGPVTRRTMGVTWEYGDFNFLMSNAEAKGAPSPEKSVLFPHWVLVVATSLLPALWMIQRTLRRSGSQAHLCPSCGYDLRGTPDRCPECGAIPPTAKGSAAGDA